MREGKGGEGKKERVEALREAYSGLNKVEGE